MIKYLPLLALCLIINLGEAEMIQNFCFDRNIFDYITNGVDAVGTDWQLDYNLVGVISISQASRYEPPNRIDIYLKPYMVCRFDLTHSDYISQEYGDYGTDWLPIPHTPVTMTGDFTLYGPSGWTFHLPSPDFGDRNDYTHGATFGSIMPYGTYELRGTLMWNNAGVTGTSLPISFYFQLTDPLSREPSEPGYFLYSFLIWGKTTQMVFHEGDGRGVIVHPLGIFRYYVSEIPPICNEDNVTISTTWNKADVDGENTYEYTPNYLCYFHLNIPPWGDDCYGSEGYLSWVSEPHGAQINVEGLADYLDDGIAVQLDYRCGAKAILTGGSYEIGVSVGASVGVPGVFSVGAEISGALGFDFQYMTETEEFDFNYTSVGIDPCYCEDIYENDNNYSSATVLDDISTGEHSQNHTLAPIADEDWLQFEASEGDQFTFYSVGGTDTYGEIYGDPPSSFLIDDDDSGTDCNFMIEDWESPSSGWYYLKIRGYNEFMWGCYILRYSKSPSEIYSLNNKPKELSISISPNPFNSAISINYFVPKNSNIEIKIFNMMGYLIASPMNKNQSTGVYTIIWTAPDDIPSGIYFVRLKAGEQTIVKRAILMK